MCTRDLRNIVDDVDVVVDRGGWLCLLHLLGWALSRITTVCLRLLREIHSLQITFIVDLEGVGASNVRRRFHFFGKGLFVIRVCLASYVLTRGCD